MESRHGRKQKPVRSKARQGFTAVAAIDRGNGQTGSDNGGDKDACDVRLHAVRRHPEKPGTVDPLGPLRARGRAAPDCPDEPVESHARTEDDEKQDHRGRPDRLRPENQDDLLYVKSCRPSLKICIEHQRAGPGRTTAAPSWQGVNKPPAWLRPEFRNVSRPRLLQTRPSSSGF